jgi:hypothetical protein
MAAKLLRPLCAPSQASLLATIRGGGAFDLVAGSLGCETGRRAVIWLNE